MYNGRPLLPIAPGGSGISATIVPVSIISAGSITTVRHTALPPPYDTTSKGSPYQPISANTIVTSTTRTRMVAPINFRMISPSSTTHVVNQGDTMQTMSSQNLATVLVVSKGQVTNRIQPGSSTMAGAAYPGQAIRVPISPGPSRYPVAKVGSQNIIVAKQPQNAIKIHGPMVDQPPGAMCPSGPDREVIRRESSPRKVPIQPLHRLSSGAVHKISSSAPQVILPKEEGTTTIVEYPPHHQEFTSSIRPISPARPNYIPLKRTAEPNLGSPSHHAIRRSPLTPQNMGDIPKRHMGQPLHIHHPNMTQYRSSPADEGPMHSKSPQRFSVSPSSTIIHIPDQDDIPDRSSSTRSAATMTSPVPDNVKHINLSSHLDTVVSSHSHHHHNYLTVTMANHASHSHSTSSRLHVVTTNHDGSQAATSPLLSPPPLIRPAPSGSQRSIAMRSPPNLTPSNAIRPHFDFPPGSSGGHYVPSPSHLHPYHNRHQRPIKVRHASASDGSSNVSIHRGQQAESQHMMQTEPEMADKGVGTHGPGSGPSSGVTVTLTYIPLKSANKDKIVYVPVNQNSGHSKQQMMFYKQPPNSGHHHPPNSGHHHHHHHHHRHMESNSHMNPVTDRLGNRMPFPGVTRKFTVRSLQRDSMLGSGQFTTVRIQGSNLQGMPDDAQEDVPRSSPHPTTAIKVEEPDLSEPKKDSEVKMNEELVDSEDLVIDTEKLDDSKGEKSTKVSGESDSSLQPDEKDQQEILLKDDSDVDKEDGDDKDYDIDEDEEQYDEDGQDDDVEDEDDDYDDETRKKQPNWFPKRRRKGLKRLFTRKKGATSAYKMKYKQAIQQAKMMRERRPNFSKRLSGSDKTDREPEHLSDALSDPHSIAANGDPNNPLSPEEGKNRFEDTFTQFEDTPNQFEDTTARFADLTREPIDNNVSNGNYIGKKAGLSSTDPAGLVRRRKRRAITTHEDDYFYGKWVLSADGQLRKKRKKHLAGRFLCKNRSLPGSLSVIARCDLTARGSEGKIFKRA